MKLPDLDIINNSNLVVANSASQLAEIDAKVDYINRVRAEKEDREHNAILQTAEFTGEQKELLEKQLEEVKQQNAKLEEANKILNALYEQAKKDADDNAKMAKTSKRQANISIVISVLAVGVAIVMGFLEIVL